MTKAMEYAQPGERTVATRIVNAAISAGFKVSVHDSEEWTVKRSANHKTILEALATTGEDTIELTDANGSFGRLFLVWGNAPDGSELVNDCSAANYEQLAALESFLERATKR